MLQLERVLELEKEKVSSLNTISELLKENHLFNNLVKEFLSANTENSKQSYIKDMSTKINNDYLLKMSELTKNGKYKRINKLRNELVIISNSQLDGDDRGALELLYSIDTFFEAEVYKTYETFAKVAKEKGFNRVFDIGTAFGLQSEVFLNEGIDYVGINDGNLDFWNKDKFEYIVGEYPFKIEAKETDLAVSSLCLTWNCYLYEGEKTLSKQCNALSRDFDACLLYMQISNLDFVAKYFRGYEIIDKNIVYFYH